MDRIFPPGETPVDVWKDITTDFDVCALLAGHAGPHKWRSRFAPVPLEDLAKGMCLWSREKPTQQEPTP